MKRILSLVLALILAISISGISVCAETYSDKAIIILSKKNVNVGDTVTVTISQTSSYAMAAIEGDLQYNNSVLQFVSGESGNTANKGSTVKIVKDSAPTNSISVSVKFKAIAAGSGSLSYSGKSYSDEDDGKAAAGTAITVKEKELSKNNNLGSLKINHGTLTPAFKAGKLDYTVSVKYDVTNVTISANAEAGDAKVAGVGTFDLKVGDNKRSITVTAASGDKKTYTIKIKRAAEEKPKDEDKDKEKEETEDEKQEDELENNPLSFPNGEVEYFIVADISDMPDFEGYTKDTLEIEDTKVGYYKDNSGKYNLVWATDKNGENGGFFNLEANDSYTKVNYLQDEGRIYIIEPFDSDININTQFVPSTQEVSGDRIECYRYIDLELKDYCVFCCYLNGENDYYKFNTKDNTVQLEPEFIYVAQETDAEINDLASTVSEAEKSEENVIANFKNLGTQAKLLI
ncbi:MAG: cadherin-like beta sandwich domain-containing protein, partial [Clostridia bacterium]|nr:cadherin-like beta sandwich domain-containing protein [Clostridia bacterium]